MRSLRIALYFGVLVVLTARVFAQAGATGTILLILDLWMLVRHRRAKREAE